MREMPHFLACFAIAVIATLPACGPAPAAPTEVRKPAAPLTATGLYGKIIPHRATALHAPANVFRMKGWRSSSNSIKLLEIAADGTRIEAGKELAHFEFGSEEALPWIKRRITESEADLESARSQVRGERERLSADSAVKGLARESADLDLGKEGLVSDRDLQLLKLGASRARVEEANAGTLAVASAAQTSSDLAYLQARADDWKTGITRYKMFEGQTHVVAPHAGWVRYAYLNHVRRKVQKSDEMPSGIPFAYVAEDETLSVELFVPELRIRSISLGQKVRVRLPDEERRVDAVVREIAPFPQEIGFLRGDDDLPDAREKAYSVIADFDPTPPFFSSGIEVRVEP
jgi:hypothetical protein